ncbi:MAG TPA: cupin domain-containing protein [Thermoanaerobaculia bacterium]|jgi:quercetin dioxygenase-like cupin family protein|nr:cupin domain-containing protein [Thermoanaerobaculia bacterium]
MMRRIGFSALSLLCLSLLVAATRGVVAEAPAVEITAEPSHHLAIENDQVRVFQVEVPPHAATLLHHHGHDYLFVTLGDAHFMNEVQGKASVEVKLADGETRFSPGDFAHVAKNLADRPFRNVTVELVQDGKLRQAPSPWPPESEGSREFPGGRIKVLFIHDGARVSEVELQPGATVPSHHHDGPHLVVAVSNLELRSDFEGRGPVSTQLKSGDVKWQPGGYTHTLTNTGKSPARLVTVEFKPVDAHP